MSITPADTMPTGGEGMEAATNVDIEATATAPASARNPHRPNHGDKSLAIKRTISFRDGHNSRPGQGIRRRAARAKGGLSDGEERSIASDTDDGDYSMTENDDDDDVDEDHDNDLLDEVDDDDDDAQSTFSTDASFISEDEPDDEHRKPSRMSRLTPAIIARRREKRRRRRQREERERDVNNKNTKVYRRMPVLTGVIAPFSIMLEIPGFTSRWYVSRDPTSGSVTYRANPIILDVGLAISLGSAIVANISILGRFAERIAPRRSTLVAGTCLILHDVINSVALIAFGVVHAVNDGFTYSEAYWMTAAATAASLICTASLIIDYVVTTNFRNAGSGLTPKQAQLVMVIMAFLAYISISAMIYALIQPLPFLDSMYFMVETLATVGLGDITPSSLGGRIALFFIAPGGIVLLAVVVAIARQTIIEEFENAYKRRRAIFKQKAAERKEERRKNRHLRIKIKRGSGRGGSSSAVLPPNAALALLEAPTMSSSMSQHTPYPAAPPARRLSIPTATTADGGRWFGGSWATGFSRRGANAPQHDNNQLSYAEQSLDGEDGRIPLDYVLGGGHALQRTDTAATTSLQLREFESMLVNQRQGIEQSFKQFRLDLAKAERNEFWTKLGVAASLFACFWLVGAAIFSAIEGWSYFQGFYFVFVVFTSIGYGDFSPKTSAGRAFFIVWALFGVGTLTILFSVVSDAWANRVQQRKLAGEEVKKKKSLWSKMANKVKGKKGRARVASREKKKAEAEKMREEEEEEEKRRTNGDVSPDGSNEKDSQETAVSSNGGGGEAKGGGILRDPNSKDTFSPPKVDQQNPAEGKDLKGEALNLSQLHMDFTTKAMEFHQSALGFMQNNRSNVVEAFRHVPEMRDTLEKMQMSENGTSQKKLSDVDRYMLLERVKESGDEKAIESTHQWLLLQDFEHMVHSLVEKSGYFESEINKREGLLQHARDQVDRLEAKLRRASVDRDQVGQEEEKE